MRLEMEKREQTLLETINTKYQSSKLFECLMFLLKKQKNDTNIIDLVYVDSSECQINILCIEEVYRNLFSLLLKQNDLIEEIQKTKSQIGFSKMFTQQIKIKYAQKMIEDDDYLIIELLNSYRLDYEFIENIYIPNRQFTQFKIMITSDLNILYYSLHQKKWFPLNLSRFSYFLNRYCTDQQQILWDLFEFLGTKNLLFCDLLKDYKERLLYLPYTFNQIMECKTKRELLQLSFKNIEIPKRLNKENIHIAYLLMKCKKYVKEDEWNKLFEIDFSKVTFYKSNVSEQIRLLFFHYYYQKILKLDSQKRTLNDLDEILIEDYINLKIKYDRKKKLNLNIKSYRRIKEEHDKLEDSLREKNTPVIKIPKDSRFKNLKLPKEFELIKTRKRLILESRIQHHCVWSYGQKINNDRCCIYSIVRNGERYTLEVVREKNKFRINQFMGKFNTNAPNELVQEVNYLLSTQVAK